MLSVCTRHSKAAYRPVAQPTFSSVCLARVIVTLDIVLTFSVLLGMSAQHLVRSIHVISLGLASITVWNVQKSSANKQEFMFNFISWRLINMLVLDVTTVNKLT